MVSITDCGLMKITSHWDAEGIEHLEYDFVGGPYLLTGWHYYSNKGGDVFDEFPSYESNGAGPKMGSKIVMGPYKFRVIGWIWGSDSIIAVQERRHWLEDVIRGEYHRLKRLYRYRLAQRIRK